MKQKKYYLPNGNAQRGTWLSNFDKKLPGFADKLGLVKAETDSVHADTLVFIYALVLVAASKSFEHQCTTFLASQRTASESGDVLPIPEFTIEGELPVAVVGGIIPRICKLVKKIKNSNGYTKEIGDALGIIGAEMSERDGEDTIQPTLTFKIIAGVPQLKYVKGDSDGIRLETKRGTETEFTFLDKINRVTYSDSRPNLVEGKPEDRQYRAWFFKKDEILGKVSAIITITVNK